MNKLNTIRSYWHRFCEFGAPLRADVGRLVTRVRKFIGLGRPERVPARIPPKSGASQAPSERE